MKRQFLLLPQYRSHQSRPGHSSGKHVSLAKMNGPWYRLKGLQVCWNPTLSYKLRLKATSFRDWTSLNWLSFSEIPLYLLLFILIQLDCTLILFLTNLTSPLDYKQFEEAILSHLLLYLQGIMLGTKDIG